MIELLLFAAFIVLALALGLVLYYFGQSDKEKTYIEKEMKANEEAFKVAQRNASLSDDVVIGKLRKHNSKSKIAPMPK